MRNSFIFWIHKYNFRNYKNIMRYIQILLFAHLFLFNSVLFSQNSSYLIYDRFAQKNLNTSTWEIIRGNPLVSASFTMDSENPYSLKLSGQDEIHSRQLAAATGHHLRLSFFYRSQNAEKSDYLSVRVTNSANPDYIHLIGGQSTEIWTYFEKDFKINSDCAAIELAASCDDDFEAFYIDNIELIPPPEISIFFQPDPPDIFFSRRDTTRGQIHITNYGSDTLFYALDLEDPHQPHYKIAILGYSSDDSDIDSLANLLRNHIPYCTIRTINLFYPSLSIHRLNYYNAILYYPFSLEDNDGSVGDKLADYVDSGGGLVLTSAAHEGSHLKGRFKSDNYFAIPKSSNYEYTLLPGYYLLIQRMPISSHPIIQDVGPFVFTQNVNYHEGNLHPEAFLIAELNSDFILAAIRYIHGSRLVDINLNPLGFESQNFIKLLANSLKWAAQKSNSVHSIDKYFGVLAQSRRDTICHNFDESRMILDRYYSQQIHIYSNASNQQKATFRMNGIFEKATYDFELSKISPDSTTHPGSSIYYTCSLENCGKLPDGYLLSTSNNEWMADFYNQPDGKRIEKIERLAAGDSQQFLIKVDIPTDALYFETDTLRLAVQSMNDPMLVDTLEFVTGVIIPPTNLPWSESFSQPILDNSRWKVVSGKIELSDEKFLSSPYSLVLDSTDAIVTNTIRLPDQNGICIEYFVKCPDRDVSCLTLSYFTGKEWIQRQQLSGHTFYSSHFRHQKVDIYPSSENDSIQFKFHVESVDNADTSLWYIDNIDIYEPGIISVETIPGQLDFSLSQGDTASATIRLTNIGGTDASYQIHFHDTSPNNLMTGSGNIQQVVSAMKHRWDIQQQEHLSKAELNGEVIQFSSNANSSTPFDIAILGCEHLADVYEKILSTKKFSSVTMINARVFLPTLNELAAFDALFVYSGENFGFYRHDSLGTILADYVDMGKGVVIGGAVFAATGNRQIGGRFREQNYFAIEPGYWGYRSVHHDSIRFSHYSNNPILNSIESFRGNFTIMTAGNKTNPGSEIVEHWEEIDEPAVVTKFIGNTPRVDLAFLPYSSDADPERGWLSDSDGAMLMANAIAWTANAGDITRLVSLSKYKGALLPQQSENVKISIQTDRAILDKNYRGLIVIRQENSVGIPLIMNLQINSRDYYFSLVHDSLQKTVIPGQHVNYRFSIYNKGSLTDSYKLQIEYAKWQASFMDEARKNSITEITNVPSNNVASFFVRHGVPVTAFLNQKDTVAFEISSMGNCRISEKFILATTTKWIDTFQSDQLDTSRWKIVRGYPHCYQYGLNGLVLRIPGNSAIETTPIDFSHYKEREIYLKFRVVNSSINVDEDLIFTGNNGISWTEIARLTEAENEFSTWLADSCLIPAEIMSENFKVKFETEFDQGYWFLDDIEFVDITSKQELIPDSSFSNGEYMYRLTPNFPNPFNPVTRIHYTIPEAGHVRISIFNLLGQNVIILVDEVQQPGHYFATWDGSDFAAGLYFYRIEINQFVKSRKMILMK
ncbi:T9SS type A sorting domain-containing protein [candidate division KSB1 bacterium]|nr:T9SS type A sorting domain-containing protein [candidate division KSB1 bacterium]